MKRALIEIGIFVGVLLTAWGLIAVPWLPREGEDFRFVKAIIAFPIAIALWIHMNRKHGWLQGNACGDPYLDRVCGICHREMRADGESWVCPECGRVKPRAGARGRRPS
jgi:hypothetical protein